ncbi:MAG TPA: homoserine O-acetyltransferase [Steroidobacteraceae bacterium]|nr:homoserine O-acetyltransferase [Steroidobacteraceae bacterium]
MSGQPREKFGHADSKEMNRAVAAELAEVSLGPATKFAALPDPFRFWRGGALSEGRVAYETWGSLNAARDNAVLLFTGLSPSAHAASSPEDPSSGWWEKMVGPDKAIDTNRYFVVCVNSLGSCFGSSGPASIDPATGLAYRLDFPDLSIEDIARGGYETIRSLGIDRLSAVVGASLGGMAVLAFAVQFAGVARRVISISGSPAAMPFAIALRSTQRDAILTDPDWQDGQYTGDVRPITGMRLARKLGTLTYRSAAEWKHRFGRRPASDRRYETLSPGRAHFPAEFAVQDYLNAQADKFVSVFDPNCYLYLSRAIDRFDLSAHGGTPVAALKRAAAERALIIGVESDILFTINEQNALAEAFTNAGTATDFVPLASLEGHDAFLVDIEPFAAAIGKFLGE